MGGFDNSCDVDYVLTDAAGKQLADQLAVGMQKIKYYVDDLEQREELVKQLQSELKPYQKMFRVKVTIPAEQQVKAYRNKMKDKTRSNGIVCNDCCHLVCVDHLLYDPLQCIITNGGVDGVSPAWNFQGKYYPFFYT